MDAVVRAHPQDLEATIFYALAVNQTALPTDKTYAPQLKAAAILEPLFDALSRSSGARALHHPCLRPSAAAPSAPSPPRAPTPRSRHPRRTPCTCRHTRSRASGRGRSRRTTNRVSEQTALRQGVATEALHAMDYQAYAYLQMVQDGAARDVIERLPAASALFNPTATAGGAAPPMAGYFALAAIPARYALERGAWDEAAQLEVPSNGTPFTMAITHFARALGAARSGRPAAASNDLERLATLRDQLTQAQDAYWAEQVDIQRRVAAAFVAFADGRRVEAVEALRSAADAEDATDKSAVSPRTARAGARALGRDAARCRRCGRRSRRVRGIDGKGARAFPRRIWRGACGRGGR